MGEKVSMRQAGKEILGKLYKGPITDAYNRLSQPSIPTKLEQILIAPTITEGFNTSAQRFSISVISQPGPADYNASVASNSKKSFRMTQSSRFKKNQYFTSVPGPGSYDSDRAKSSGITISGRSKVLKPNNNPSPGFYDPHVLPSTKETTSMFKSCTKRMNSAFNPENPPPWQYHPIKPTSSGKITAPFIIPNNRKREQINLYDPHAKPVLPSTPGPGDYDHKKMIKNTPSSMFLAKEVDRFGRPIRRRKKEFLPGPGDYSFEKENKKSMVTGAVFSSESKRVVFNAKGKPPGPAFYTPTPVPKKKSFHFKTAKIWV